LNPQPPDYKSGALPIELRQQITPPMQDKESSLKNQKRNFKYLPTAKMQKHPAPTRKAGGER
jgi:hypothetical protein